jgi:hypothetical protein
MMSRQARPFRGSGKIDPGHAISINELKGFLDIEMLARSDIF